MLSSRVEASGRASRGERAGRAELKRWRVGSSPSDEPASEPDRRNEWAGSLALS